MNEHWAQVNITYPGNDPREREHRAVDHLTRALPTAENDGLITAWWFIRKGPWRIRYRLADGHNTDPLHPIITDGITWTRDIYEPETHAFGGPAGMNIGHTLFHADSRHLLPFLTADPADRRERSLVLCTALMHAAGLDLNEQGDVWARLAEQRAPFLNALPDNDTWQSFTRNVHRLITSDPDTDLMDGQWLTAFTDAGRALRILQERGELTRGVRAITALHVIFHWNRIGLTPSTQATLAHAAKDAIFGQ
ncbi:thiopeptide-type bacteriocin biosynthesis protein [Actinomadura craniellae]|uniref:thiopeptide-type bacteriocin biosynthesis protein n=1 Tax=Actinomadura craniellae TaxID=2231787 RepID=UPI001F23CCD3|nr:thiopeptide-type bacteriocin biosynthesis protein [Actinomadura craniellae]